MKNRLAKTSLFLCALLVTAAASSNQSDGREADRETLLALNESLVRTQLIDRDASVFSELALDEFRVLAPGGLIESKAQAEAGVAAWDVVDVELSGTEIVFHGDIAIMMGRMDIDGIMNPVGRWGPLKYMSTWVKEDGDWRLLSRSLTPCLEKLIELGRC